MWRHVLFTEFMSLLENITWQLSSTSKILIDLLISTFTPWLIRHLTSEILAYKTFNFSWISLSFVNYAILTQGFFFTACRRLRVNKIIIWKFSCSCSIVAVEGTRQQFQCRAVSKLKHSPRFFPSYFTLVQFWIVLSSFAFAFNLWKERPRGCSIKLVLLSCDRERFNQCWQETRKLFDIEPRAYGLFMLTMNGWWLKNHRKEYQGSWKAPHFFHLPQHSVYGGFVVVQA